MLGWPFAGPDLDREVVTLGREVSPGVLADHEGCASRVGQLVEDDLRVVVVERPPDQAEVPAVLDELAALPGAEVLLTSTQGGVVRLPADLSVEDCRAVAS